MLHTDSADILVPTSRSTVYPDLHDNLLEDNDHYNHVKAFLLEWGIDVSNAVDLMRCTRGQQVSVMDDFCPEDNGDANASFQTIVSCYLKENLTNGFVQKWGLDQ